MPPRPSQAHPLQRAFQQHLRNSQGRPQSRVECTLCAGTVQHGLEFYTRHFEAEHGDILQSEREATADEDAASIIRKYYHRSLEGQKRHGDASSPPLQHRRKGGRPTTISKPDPESLPTPISPPPSGASPKAAAAAQRVASPATHGDALPRRSRARAPQPTDDAEFARESRYQSGSLWTGPDTKPTKSTHPKTSSRHHRPRSTQQQQQQQHPSATQEVNEMLKAPETSPISPAQLVAEVKGIYTGLVMVETKCIEVDTAQTKLTDEAAKKLTDKQWQALVALHRALLHEHHDFFLASQHPTATISLKRLASKYSMPARMWRHGIHSFLELLRHRLPESKEHMQGYIYLAYNMMALLYETVPVYKETWIECLGDLGRYRMAIEDDNMFDREIWTEVSKQWYQKASDLSPSTGRLYHHLAILARPDWLQQLFYYSKSLCVSIPFVSARESIQSLFGPLLVESTDRNVYDHQEPVEAALVQAHACLFMRKRDDIFQSACDKFLGPLDNHIARTARFFMGPAYYIAISNICGILEYGAESNPIYDIIRPTPRSEDDEQEQPVAVSNEFVLARKLAWDTARVVLGRLGDPNVWPFVHVTLAFLNHLASHEGGMTHLEHHFPWTSLMNLLNTLHTPGGAGAGGEGQGEGEGDAEGGEDGAATAAAADYSRYEQDDFKVLVGDSKPLPEDYAIRGLLWAEGYHAPKWFDEAAVDDDEKYLEVPSMGVHRKDRMVWLGCRIAKSGNGRWLRYDAGSRVFSVAPEFAQAPEGGQGIGEPMEMDTPQPSG